MAVNLGSIFSQVQNAAVNRERIDASRLEREKSQYAFMRQQEYDRAKEFENFVTSNGYADTSGVVDFNKMGADLLSDDPARKQIAERGYLMLGNEVQGENAPFTFDQIVKGDDGRLAFAGNYKDSDQVAVATESGDTDPNSRIQTLDLDTLNRNAELVYNNVVRSRLYDSAANAKALAIGDMMRTTQAVADQTGNTGIVRAGVDAVSRTPEEQQADTAAGIIEEITGQPYVVPEDRKAEIREDAGDREYLGFGKVRSVARFDRLNNELTSLKDLNNPTSIQQRRVQFLEKRLPELRSELQVELSALQDQRAQAVAKEQKQTMDPEFWRARADQAANPYAFNQSDLMPPAEKKFAREIKALEDKLGVTEQFANMAPVVDKVDTIIAGDAKNIKAAKDAGALNFTPEEQQAVAADARKNGITKPEDLRNAPVRQQNAIIATLISRFQGKDKKGETELYNALMNYATTGDPTMSAKDAATAANSKRTAATAATARLDKLGDDIDAAYDDIVVPIQQAVFNGDKVVPWDEIEPEVKAKMRASLGKVQAVAVGARGSTKGIAADTVLIEAVVLPLLSFAKQTDKAGLLDDVADIIRDEASSPTGNLGAAIYFDYDEKGNPKVINFKDPEGGLYEESISFTDAKKVLGPAALGKLRRLDAALKAQSQPQGE